MYSFELFATGDKSRKLPIPALSPLRKLRLSCSHLVRLRGVFMRRREAGRGAAPAGSVRKLSTRAALELPPGPLGVPARSWLTTWVLRYRPPAYLSAMP